MKDIKATIIEIENTKQLHRVVFEICQEKLSMFSLQLPSAYKVGSCVKLSCNPTAIAIAKDLLDTTQVSYENQLRATITKIDKGKLLSVVSLDICGYMIESVISTKSLDKMQLLVGDSVVALIKASELAISGVCDDR
jgi:molybdopterin-binding protein